MSEKTKIIAVITARGGSKGLPGKNIIDLGGKPMLAYTVLAGIESKLVDTVVVTTDDEKIKEIAIEYGAEVPFLRSKKNSSDKATDLDLMNEVIHKLISTENFVDEFIIHLRPTTPFRRPDTIIEAMKRIMGDKNSTSLRSGHLCSESPMKWFMKGDQGYFKPLDTTLSSEDINKPRHDFPDVFIPNGYVDVLKSEYILENNSLHGDRMIVFETEKITEIDTQDDIEYLDYELKAKAPDLLKAIKEYNIQK